MNERQEKDLELRDNDGRSNEKDPKIQAHRRQALKKFKDNLKLKEKIRLGNKVMEEIITQTDKYQNITMINKLIYATAEALQDTVIPPKKHPTDKETWTDIPHGRGEYSYNQRSLDSTAT